MAVWLCAWAKNPFDNMAQTVAHLQNTPIDIPLDLSFLADLKLTAPWEESVHLDYQYQQTLWKLTVDNNSFSLLYELPSNIDGHYNRPYWQFGLHGWRDVLSFSGPFDHFSQYWLVPANKTLSRGWLSVITSIYQYLQVREVVFFTEWSGFDHEANLGFTELQSFLSTHPERLLQQFCELSGSTMFYIHPIELLTDT